MEPKRHGLKCLAAAVCVHLAGVSPAFAQKSPFSRISFDTVVTADRFSLGEYSNGSDLIFDAIITASVTDKLLVIVRPMSRRPSSGMWSHQVPQLSVRFESGRRVPFRFEAGHIGSPVGLATLRWRADDNPTIGMQRYYYMSLPRVEPGAPSVRAISAGYPFGAQASVSTKHWDARFAVVDSSPTRPRKAFVRSNPPRMPQIELGGGYTPFAGLRIGISMARGNYAGARTVGASSVAPGRRASLLNLEGEYAFRHTRISAEWVRDHFETSSRDAVFDAWFLEGMQNLSARWFGAARMEQVTGHTASKTVLPASVVETVAGYRVNPTITLRAGLVLTRTFTEDEWDKQLGTSIVFAQRWR